MFRLRRYRIFLVVSFFLLFGVWYVSQGAWYPTNVRPVEVPQGRPVVVDTSRPLDSGLSPVVEQPVAVAHEDSEKAPSQPQKVEDDSVQKIAPIKQIKPVEEIDSLGAKVDLVDPSRHVLQVDGDGDGIGEEKNPVVQQQQEEDDLRTDPVVEDEDDVPPSPVEGVTFEIPRNSWVPVPDKYPVQQVIALPSGSPKTIPRVQRETTADSERVQNERHATRQSIKNAMLHSWTGYKKHAWGKDELRPESGSSNEKFMGWAATLVDSLDTLWLMGMTDEFEEAVASTGKIDFKSSTMSQIPVFETTIRYMGGLLGAYDISGHKYRVLLEKATELGEVLMGAFDTINRMPVLYYPFSTTGIGRASGSAVLAELGSLVMEFTRLAQLTKEAKYYDAVARITDALEEFQNKTALPGLWPVHVDATGCDLAVAVDKDGNEDENVKEGCHRVGLRAGGWGSSDTFTLGGEADSTYEYLPKTFLLLGGLNEQYKTMYIEAIDTAKKHLLFRGMHNDSSRPLFYTGSFHPSSLGKGSLDHSVGHLTCFVGGMFALGAKVFDRPEDLEIASRLTDGCVWLYSQTATGIMPEDLVPMACESLESCPWDQKAWEHVLDPAGDTRDAMAGVADDGADDDADDGGDDSDSMDARTAAEMEEDDKFMTVEKFEDVKPDEVAKPEDDPAKDPIDPAAVDTNPPAKPAAADEAPAAEPVTDTLATKPRKRQLYDYGHSVPQRTTTRSHSEFVQSRIQNEHLWPGITSIKSTKYLLRPEAIESVFYMWRITGDDSWRQKGLAMFQAVNKYTHAQYGHSAILDVTSAEQPGIMDEMESFWSAETLKYFYLLFCDDNVLSLDDWVL